MPNIKNAKHELKLRGEPTSYEALLFSHLNLTKTRLRSKHYLLTMPELRSKLKHYNKQIEGRKSKLVARLEGIDPTPADWNLEYNQTSPISFLSPSHIPPLNKKAKKTKAKTKKHLKPTLHTNAMQLPAGTGNAFVGLKFVVTGTLPEYGRDEVEALIKNYGGRLQKNPSKTTNYVVVGNKPGTNKIRKAEELKLEQLNEDGLITMLNRMQGLCNSVLLD